MINFDEVKEEAIGKWPGIFAELGIDVGNGKHKSCPVCGGKDRYRFDDKDGKGTWYCNNCQAGDGWKLVQNVLGIGFKEAMEQVAPILGKVEEGKQINGNDKSTPEALRKMFIESEPAYQDNLVGQYLRHRGLKTVPEKLRYLKNCWCSEAKKEIPAMLGVVHLPDKQSATIHRTYLDIVSASKADVKNPKKMMPVKQGIDSSSGGAIRLFEPEERAVGVAEGIETAIACYERFHIPTWAVVSSAMMQAFTPPAGIDKIYIFGDNDSNFAGQKAAYNLANRLVTQLKYKDVFVYIPENAGDWLDNIKE